MLIHSAFVSLACIGAFPLAAATAFNGGNLFSGSHWNSGLPAPGNDGSVANDGAFAGNLDFNTATAGSVTVGHGSGALTGDYLNLRNDAAGGATYQWNQYGGSVTASSVVANNRVTYTLVGGTIMASAAPSGGARIQAVNGGRFHQTGGTVNGLGYDFSSNTPTTHQLTGGSGVKLGAAWSGSGVWVFRVANLNTVMVGGDWTASFRNFTPAEFVVAPGGSLAFQSDWTGSMTHAAFAAGNGWETVLTRSGVTVAGTAVTPANFDTLFQLADDGARVSLKPLPDDSPQALVDLATYDVTWNTHGTGEADNMPLGNGRAGANVWVSPDGDLELYLSHNDAVSELHRLLKLGKLKIAFSPSPFGKDKPIRQKLVLRGGRIEISAGIPGESVALQLWMDSESDVLHVTGTSEIPRGVTVSLVNWRGTQRTLGTSELASTWNYRTGVLNGVDAWESADVIKTRPQGLMWYHRNAYSSLPVQFQYQGLAASLPHFNDPLVNRTSGVLLSGTGFASSGAQVLQSTAPLTTIDLKATVKVARTATAAEWEGGVEQVRASHVTSAASRARTAVWWENYWTRSWLFMEESPARVVTENARPLRIGADQNGGNRSGGNVAAITALPSVLEASQISALAAASPTSPATALPDGWTATAPAVANAGGIALNAGWLETSAAAGNTLFAGDFTLAAWIKPAALGCRIFDKITPGGTDGMLFDTHNGLRVILGSRSVQVTATLQSNTWQHVACTVSAARQEVVLYLNGLVVTRQSWSDGLPGYPVTRAYVLSKLLTAMQVQGETPAHFQGGIFTVDPKIAFYANNPNTFDSTPDYRFYGCNYWWQNARFIYLPLLAQGWYEPVRKFIDFYASKRDLFKDRARHYYGAEGVYFQEVVNLAGLPGMGDFGWGASEYSEGYTRNIWQQSLELAVLMQDYYEHTGDEAFLQSTLIPWTNDALKFYDTRFAKQNGKIRIFPTHAVETYWTDVVNDMPSVAGLHAVTSWMLKLPLAKVAAEDRAIWTRMASQLPALPKRVVNGITVPDNAESYNPTRSNYEAPDLYSVFPFRIYGLNRTEHAIGEARQAWTAMPNPGHVCWYQTGVLAARLGMTDGAKEDVIHRANHRMSRSDQPGRTMRFPGYMGSPHDWCPDFDGPGNMMNTLQEMLLQPGPHGTLLLAAAWPDDWNVSFKLRAAGNTTVEGTVRNGSLVQLKTEPAARIADIRLIGEMRVAPDATADPYDAWRLQHFPGRDGSDPAGALRGADPDGDGITNEDESKAGTDPLDRTSAFRLEAERTSGGLLELRFTAVANHAYKIEKSPDLKTWSDHAGVAAEDLTRSIRVQLALTKSSKFFRAVSVP